MTGTISGIVLENFRSFSSRTEIRLRPITLLYGQNSAGKSSVIKSLLLLQQSFASGARDGASFFVFAGESVDLGSIQATISGHDQKKELGVGIETTVSDTSGAPGRSAVITWFSNESSRHSSLNVEINIRGHVVKFERHPRRPRWLLWRDSIRPFLDLTIDKSSLFAQSNDMVENLRSNLGYLPEFIGDHYPSRLQRNLVPPATRTQWLNSNNFPNQSLTSEPDEAGGMFDDNPLIRAWNDITSEYWKPTSLQIKRLTHIGPLRQQPLRFDRYSPTTGTVVGSAGEEMLSLLYEKPSLVLKVNEYLAMMDLPYKVKIVSLGSPETVGRVIYLALVNRKTGLEVSPSDVGVGYSQVLPLITQSTVARDRLLCIEQPELHLHPAMQARLGDLFISESMGGSRTRFLIETHSESLMLRIMRRIREGSLRPNDVQVIYVDQDTNGASSIHELPLNDNGDFAESWPHGFFDERLEELGF